MIGSLSQIECFRRRPASQVRRRLRQATALAAVLASCLLPTITWASSPPDGRVYELVSPAEKNGNEAGIAPGSGQEPAPGYSISTPEGSSLLYRGTGPFGDTVNGIDDVSIARRSSPGWASSGVLPRGQGLPYFSNYVFKALDPAADLSQVLFGVHGSFTPRNPAEAESSGLYLVDSLRSIAWVSEPVVSNPVPSIGQAGGGSPVPAGGSPDLGTVYFTYYGTLVEADGPRTGHVLSGEPAGSAWGFYEWRDGKLSAAGVRPDGSLDQYGAVPAATGHNGEEDTAEEYDNEVSTDGSRAFFVSPDPIFCEEHQHQVEGLCKTDPPELYVRETAADGTQSTALVSEDTLLLKVQGLSAPAPHGPLAIQPPHFTQDHPSYVYASPDGSQAFFQSTDRLTAQAQENDLPKEYDFDVVTGSLTYLPNVAGTAPILPQNPEEDEARVLASSADGSRIIFEKVEERVPAGLYLWSYGPSGGTVSKIAALPQPLETRTNNNGKVIIDPTRMTADGSVVAFETDSPLPGGFNNGGGFEQVYRYDVIAERLSCVSCPPAGVAPSGDAALTNDDAQLGPGQETGYGSSLPTRGISADGSRVFFDTTEALVPQDVNGRRDVYEWEDGHVHLISSGEGSQDSFLMDSSESGDDVFFTTADGLVSNDVDEGYDVYDARVGGGFAPPAPAPECVGDACQSPASPPASPSLVTAVAGGSGDVATLPQIVTKPLTSAQRLTRALKQCRSKKGAGRRRGCEAQARKRYGPRSKAKTAGRRRR